MNMRTSWLISGIAAGMAVSGFAASGEWSVNADGDWSDTTKWKDGIVADGAGSTADFSKVNTSVNRTVTNDSARTIGHLKFADAGLGDGSNTRGWTVTHESNVLTLDTGGAGTPSITFGAGSDNAGNAAVMNVVLAGTEGVDIQKMHTYSRPVRFGLANTYNGTTTIKDGGWLELLDDAALGSSSATVENGGRLLLLGNRTVSSTIALEDGAELVASGSSGNVGKMEGTLTVSGSVKIFHWAYSRFDIDTAIAESVAGAHVEFGSFWYDNNRGSMRLLQASSFTGNSSITRGAQVIAAHADAFGTAANTVVVNGTGTDNNRGMLTLSAATGLHADKAIEVGPYGALYIARGVTNANTINLNGGMFGFNSAGTDTRKHTGTINLGAGVTSVIDRVANSFGDWLQSGVIAGPGSLHVTGGNNNSLTMYFNGDNTYEGGTRFTRGDLGVLDRLGHNNALGAGPVWIDGISDTREVFRIADNLEMANDFRGRGRMGTTASYTLTLTGSIAPYDTGLNTVTKNIGTLEAERLQFGSATQGATYHWQYDENGSDLVHVTGQLIFGAAAPTLNIEWLGGDVPREEMAGTFTLFTYAAGANPVVSDDWHITPPPKMRGAVRLDADEKRVLLDITVAPSAGTVIRVR